MGNQAGNARSGGRGRATRRRDGTSRAARARQRTPGATARRANTPENRAKMGSFNFGQRVSYQAQSGRRTGTVVGVDDYGRWPGIIVELPNGNSVSVGRNQLTPED